MKKSASKHRRSPKARNRSAGVSRRKNTLRAVPPVAAQRLPRRPPNRFDSMLSRLSPYVNRVGHTLGRAAREVGRLIGRGKGSRVAIRREPGVGRRAA